MDTQPHVRKLLKKLILTGIAGLALIAIPEVAGAQVVLGVGGPITGANASMGDQLKNGVEQAVEDINAAGGILGQHITISIGDDVSDPKQGLSVANKFVGDGVKHVIGHFSSGVTLPASDVYAESGVVFITPAATNPQITERELWNAFRTCGRDDQQGAIAAAYIANAFKGKKIAIAHDKTPYGQGLADETRKGLDAAGLTEVLYEGLNPGEKDFAALVSKIKATGADVLYWGGMYTEAGLIARQMQDQGLKTVMMSGDGLASEEFAAIGGPAVEGTLMTFPPDPQKRPEAAAVLKQFEKRNFKPEAFTLYSYAAVEIFKQAAEAVGSLDPMKMAEFMRSGATFKTVIGDISYDSKGDITRPDYLVYKWTRDATGKLTYVEN
ncbi:branched-chain amino acid transport system substrate-binding protein [Aminobacter sp. AP02]|nr:branched-chain amino acid transport system substrate-binding protein [Aminobacter sp. AP02]